MNNRHLHLLFNDNIQSVTVVFDVNSQAYTYLVPEGMDIKAGQPVVTSIKGNVEAMDLKIAYAVEDAGAIDINWDAPFDYKYIVDVVDVKAWQMNLSALSQQTIAGKAIEKSRAKLKLRKEIEEAYSSTPDLLKSLIGGVTLEHKTDEK